MNRKIVRSFDVFDTLVGRLHTDPKSVFDLVERNYPFPNFTNLRKYAEYVTKGTLDDIYVSFQEIAKISKEEAEKIKEFEVAMELKQVFPILKNLKKISNGDILVSDSYFDKDLLLKILSKIGLEKDVEIFVTRDGKTTGQIWEKLKKDYFILLHLGDSTNSDYDSPLAAGIPAKIFKECGYSELERQSLVCGNPGLAQLMRTLRLLNPYQAKTPSYDIWEEQSQINVPVLILYSLFIHDHCRNLGKDRILFTSRDCCQLIEIFKKMFPSIDARYFFSSRYVYQNPSVNYIYYVKSNYTPTTSIIDVNGSGKNCIEFFQKHFQAYPDYIALICKKTDYKITRVTSTFQWKIEQLNYDLCGSLVGFENGKPIWLPPEYDLQYIYPAHACIGKCIELIDQYSLGAYNQTLMEFLLLALERKTNGMFKYAKHSFSHLPSDFAE